MNTTKERAMSAENFFAFIFSGGCSEHATPDFLGGLLVERLNAILGKSSDERAFQACRFLRQVTKHFQYFDIPKVSFDNGMHAITSKSREYSEAVIMEGDCQLRKDSLSFALTCYSASVAAAPEEDLGKAYSRRARALFIAQRFEDCCVDVDNAMAYRDLLSTKEVNYLVNMKRFSNNRMGYNDPCVLLDEFYVMDRLRHEELTYHQKLEWLAGAIRFLVCYKSGLTSANLALPAHLADPDFCRMPAAGRALPARSSTLPADMCRIPTHTHPLLLPGKPFKFTQWQWLVLGLKRPARLENVPTLPETNPFNLCFTDAVQLSLDHNGREVVVACRDIHAGELVAVEKPWASIVNPEEHCTYCDNCKLRSFTLVPCSRCSVAMFCNESCRKSAMLDHHRDECAVFRELLTTARSWHDAQAASLALRMFFTAWRESNRSVDFMRFRFSSIEAWPIGLVNEQATRRASKIHFDAVKRTAPTDIDSLRAVLTAASLTHLLRNHSEVFLEPEGDVDSCSVSSRHHPVRPHLVVTEHGNRSELWSTILDDGPAIFIENAYADKIKADAILLDHLGADVSNDEMMQSIIKSIAAYEQTKESKEGPSTVFLKNIENAKRSRLAMQISNPVDVLGNNSVSTENNTGTDKVHSPSIMRLMNVGEAGEIPAMLICDKKAKFGALNNNSVATNGTTCLPPTTLKSKGGGKEKVVLPKYDKSRYPYALNISSVATNNGAVSTALKSVGCEKKKPALHNCGNNAVDASKNSSVAREICVSSAIQGKAYPPSSKLKNVDDATRSPALQVGPADSLRTNSAGTKKGSSTEADDPIKDAVGLVDALMDSVTDAEKRLARKFSESFKSNPAGKMDSKLPEKKQNKACCKNPGPEMKNKSASETNCPLPSDKPSILQDATSLTAMFEKVEAKSKQLDSILNHVDALKRKSTKYGPETRASVSETRAHHVTKYLEDETKKLTRKLSDMNNESDVTTSSEANASALDEVRPPEKNKNTLERLQSIKNYAKVIMKNSGMDSVDAFKNHLFATDDNPVDCASKAVARAQAENGPSRQTCKTAAAAGGLAQGNKGRKDCCPKSKAATPAMETKQKQEKPMKCNKVKGKLDKEMLNINGLEIEANFETYDEEFELKKDGISAQSEETKTDLRVIRLNENAGPDAPSVSLDKMREFVKKATAIMNANPKDAAKAENSEASDFAVEDRTIKTFCGHLTDMMRNMQSEPRAESDAETEQEGSLTSSDISEDESIKLEPAATAERQEYDKLKLAEKIRTYNALKYLTDGATTDELLCRLWRRYHHSYRGDECAEIEYGHGCCRGKPFRLTEQPVETNALPADKDSLVSGIITFAPRLEKVKPPPKKSKFGPFTYSLDFYDENLQSQSTLGDVCVVPTVYVDRRNFAAPPRERKQPPPPCLDWRPFAKQAEAARLAYMWRRRETLGYSPSLFAARKFHEAPTFFSPALWDDLILASAELGLFYKRYDEPIAAIDDFNTSYYMNCFENLGPLTHFPPADDNFSYMTKTGRLYVASVKPSFFRQLLPEALVLNDTVPDEVLPSPAGKQPNLTHADVFYDPTSKFRDALLPWYYDFFEVPYSRRLRAVSYRLQRVQGEEALFLKALLFKEMVEFRQRLKVRRPLFGRPFTIAESSPPPPLNKKLELRLSFVASMMLSYLHLARNAAAITECTFCVDEGDRPRPPRPASHRGDTCMNPDLALSADSIDYSMIGLDSYRPFGAAVYATSTYFPHSCDPNVFALTACGDVGVWAALRHIKRGEVLTVSYGPQCTLHQRYERRTTLREKFGFQCECSACAQQMKPEQMTIPVLNLICLYCGQQLIVNKQKNHNTSICPKCKKRNKTLETNRELHNILDRIERMRNSLYGRPSRSHDFLPQLAEDSKFIRQHVHRPCQLTFAAEEVVKMALLQKIGNFYCIE